LIITTPNQDWIPECDIEPSIIQTFTDGTWGVHEYSRWPQLAIPNMWHVACIPTRRSNSDVPEILWTRLQPGADWIEDPASGIPGVGMISPNVCEALRKAATLVATRARAITTRVNERRAAFVHELCLVLWQCVERMRRVPSRPATAISVAVHVQRMCLELLGLETYLLVALPRLESGEDFREEILPVLGAIVRDVDTAEKLARAGIPTWYVQPYRPSIKVWRVAARTQLTGTGGEDLRSTPMTMAQIANPTGNWLSSMVFALSRQLCNTPYPTLHPATNDIVPVKRSRAELISNSIRLPVSGRVACDDTSSGRTLKISGLSVHPSRQYAPSPFCDSPHAWARALQAQGRLDSPPSSAVWFYPPPFLLDTCSHRAPLPVDVPNPSAAREDEKVSRYVHNLLRIREYCRIRLLDPTICGRPLSIAEWRAALWGDYDHKPVPLLRGTDGARRRAKRKHEEKCAIGQLFGDGACLESYSQAALPLFDGQAVSAHSAAHDRRTRSLVVWEAHEINWRCELLALDQAMLPRDGWPVVDRWSREAQVSAVWGLPTAVMSVIPLLSSETEMFCWRTPPDPAWSSSVPYLRAFVDIIASWPGCPPYLRRMRVQPGGWSAEEYEVVQNTAAEFYTAAFVRMYRRLPIVPVQFPPDL
ncbi:hypothetical protein C8Q76DRAFT_601331, partial [Earliella scabrosa]